MGPGDPVGTAATWGLPPSPTLIGCSVASATQVPVLSPGAQGARVVYSLLMTAVARMDAMPACCGRSWMSAGAGPSGSAGFFAAWLGGAPGSAAVSSTLSRPPAGTGLVSLHQRASSVGAKALVTEGSQAARPPVPSRSLWPSPGAQGSECGRGMEPGPGGLEHQTHGWVRPVSVTTILPLRAPARLSRCPGEQWPEGQAAEPGALRVLPSPLLP